MQFALESAREKWGDDIAEGDALLTNHPYMGGTHTPDLQVFTPLYRDGRIIAWAGSIAHHIDIGGRFPGTESAQCTELFQEGLIFPAVKLVERGTRVRALYDLIGANVRDPHRRWATSMRSWPPAVAGWRGSTSWPTHTAPTPCFRAWRRCCTRPPCGPRPPSVPGLSGP